MAQCHVDQPSGIEHVIRRVENPASFQLIGHLRAGQLIIGRSSHRSATQMGNRLRIQHTTQAAGRENVARRGKQRIAGYRVRPQLLDSQLHTPGIEVAHQQFRARGMQRFGQGEADIAQALNGDSQPFQIIAAKARLGWDCSTIGRVWRLANLICGLQRFFRSKRTHGFYVL